MKMILCANGGDAVRRTADFETRHYSQVLQRKYVQHAFARFREHRVPTKRVEGNRMVAVMTVMTIGVGECRLTSAAGTNGVDERAESGAITRQGCGFC